MLEVLNKEGIKRSHDVHQMREGPGPKCTLTLPHNTAALSLLMNPIYIESVSRRENVPVKMKFSLTKL